MQLNVSSSSVDLTVKSQSCTLYISEKIKTVFINKSKSAKEYIICDLWEESIFLDFFS